jgi:hypothetical protein
VFFLLLVQHGLALLGGFSLQLCELAFYVRTQTFIRKNLLLLKKSLEFPACKSRK